MLATTDQEFCDGLRSRMRKLWEGCYDADTGPEEMGGEEAARIPEMELIESAKAVASSR